MADNNTSKFLTWFLIAVAIAGLLIWICSLVFPQIITKLTSLFVGLFVVVTGLFLRRKK